MATKKSTKKTATKTASKTKPTNKATLKSKSASRSHPSVGSAAMKPQAARKLFPKSMKLRKSYVVLIVVIVIAAALILRYRGVFVAAVVNGQPISRLSVVEEAERQTGSQALQNLVRNTLIEQEAREQDVTVSEEEIDEEIEKVEKTLSEQGQEIDQVLATQGLSREDLRKLIRLDKLVAKIVGKDIKVTDEEVSEYIESNRDALPTDQPEEELRATVKENIRQQKLNEKVQTWLTELQTKAKIQYFVQY
jgi:parvulin-like peptidyl-prolyl isomerase